MNPKELQTLKQRYDIVGNHDGLNRALEMAVKVAKVDLSVLVVGENGVGKEVFSRIIHEASSRRLKPFLAINCGALPEGTIDSELFGHVKGAFTGSVETREGHFAAADGGTLFLDEVGELPLQTQVRLLRVLETGEFIPVGSSTVKRTNVRIVAATNVNMAQAIRQGRFREDLFYRLSAVRISIPPLRERGQDIDTLFRKFALEMSERYGVPTVRLDEAARSRLLSYEWPGNIRQLRNVAESMSVTIEGNAAEVSAQQLEAYIPDGGRMSAPVPLHSLSPSEGATADQLPMLLQMLSMLRHEVELLRAEVEALKADRGLTTALPYAQHPQGTAAGDYADAPTPTARPSALLPHATSSATSAAPAPKAATPTAEHHYIEEAEEIFDLPHTLPPSAAAKGHGLPTRQDMERELIVRALEKAGGHRKMAAEQIGISERTLYRKIKDYGLDL